MASFWLRLCPPSPSSPMQKRQHTLKRLRQEAPKTSTVHKLSGTGSSSSTSPRPPVRGQAGAATATPPKADCRGHSSVGLESAGQPPSRCCVPARARKALGTSVVSCRAGRSAARKLRREAEDACTTGAIDHPHATCASLGRVPCKRPSVRALQVADAPTSHGARRLKLGRQHHGLTADYTLHVSMSWRQQGAGGSLA
eukprot:CAMPEP_0177495096 /NCGR_PEP_ID=MMETSP0369-20130122/33792_1 /TAXON_ID=447022 ORGANISM="Scrippsiella hangoei-like, Strain SHHI-4" /NCGR_SAMPLE_ID=MMETSP0369 /ASSEMBLY_ACC=CAM_ASM_000364 /LENGTH=197 /DNA_ID=CAMNT_0018972079 /DNA_START=98 /DNA_END=689 /DNA_ORIENTATION=+